MHSSSLRNNALQALTLLKMIIDRFVSTGGFLNRYEINILPIKIVLRLILTKLYSLNLKKVKFKVSIIEMYLRILWEKLTDHLRSAKHTLGIKGLMIWRYWSKWSNKKQKTQSTGYWRSETKDCHISLPDDSFEFILLPIGHVLYSIFNS